MRSRGGSRERVVDDRPDRDDESVERAPGKAAAAGLGQGADTGPDADRDRKQAIGTRDERHAVDRDDELVDVATGPDADPDDQSEARPGGGFATDDVRADAEYADGGGDVRANRVGGLGRDTGAAGEGGPGTEGGLGSDDPAGSGQGT
jgi:hypothetical protein